MLGRHLAALNDIQVTFFFTKTSETDRRLTTSTVLLWQLHRHSLDDLLVVTLEGGKEHSITINDDETKLVIVLEEGEKRISEEGVLTLVGEDVDGSEGLKGNLRLLFGLAIFHKDHTAENAESIPGRRPVKLQLLTG